MENRASFTIVGFFLITFTIALAFFTIWLAKYNIDENSVKYFKIYTKDSISGLKINSSITYKGINVGSVKEIKINKNNSEEIEVLLQLTNPEIVKMDSKALIASKGVTGIKEVEILGGSKESPTLKSTKDNISTIPLAKGLFDELKSKAENITDRVDNLLNQMNLLFSDKFRDDLHSIFENVNKSTKHFVEQQKDIDKLIVKFDTLLAASNIENINKSISNINLTTKNFNTVSSEIHQIIQDDIKNLIQEDIKSVLNEMKTTLKKREDVEHLIYKLDNSIDNINDKFSTLLDNPSDIIFKRREVIYGPGEQIKE